MGIYRVSVAGVPQLDGTEDGFIQGNNIAEIQAALDAFIDNAKNARGWTEVVFALINYQSPADIGGVDLKRVDNENQT
jgi:hypothetical protein